ncbi:MAG: pseudouridine synthase [Desulfohalobiaceae bacterium]
MADDRGQKQVQVEEQGSFPGLGQKGQRARITLQASRSWAGSRLDTFLAQEAGLGGLRLVRGKWRQLVVQVNGLPGTKGHRLQTGDRISYLPWPASEQALQCSKELREKVQIVCKGQEYLALYKPAGVHSSSPGLRGGPGLEDILGDILPGKRPLLLNRLDRDTSGLILMAASNRDQERYQRLQDQGRVQKSYLALAQGRIAEELCLDQALDTARRRKVRILEGQKAEPLRRTHVWPLAFLPGAGLSLVRVRILKGARHQIRAHLAHAGHPVYGEQLYAATASGSRLFLHHYRITMPGFQASCLPDWKLGAG